MNAVLQFIRSLAARKKCGEQTDQHLLKQFVSLHDETAFAALLERHGPMAMGVCLRILRDKHLAEDACQAAFLILALKADKLCKRAFVPSWLYGVALRLARKLKAQTYRAQRRVVRQGNQVTCDAPMAAIKREEEELIDDEIQRLPERYRLPVLLCYFEGLTQKEAALRLGWSEGKVRALLARGRDRLRFRLVRRGVMMSAAGAALLSGTSLSATVPDSFAVATTKAALNVALAKTLTGCGASAAVTTLAMGVISMSLKKVLLILASLFLTGAVAVAAAIWTVTNGIPGTFSPAGEPVQKEAPKGQGDKTKKQGDSGAAQQKVQALLLGKWQADLGNIVLTYEFLKDGKLKLQLKSGDLAKNGDGSYKLVDDKMIETQVEIDGQAQPAAHLRIESLTEKKLIVVFIVMQREKERVEFDRIK